MLARPSAPPRQTSGAPLALRGRFTAPITIALASLALAVACKSKTESKGEEKPAPAQTSRDAAAPVADAGGDGVALVVVLIDNTRKELLRSQITALTISRVAKKRQLRGWLLADVLALATTESFQSATFYAVDTVPLILGADELADPATRATVRYNKRGLLKFNVWKTDGDEPKALHGLAGLVRIELSELSKLEATAKANALDTD